MGTSVPILMLKIDISPLMGTITDDMGKPLWVWVGIYYPLPNPNPARAHP